MSQKPTGVFVRLPLSEEQSHSYLRESRAAWDECNGLSDAIACESGLLAIGTLVTGAELTHTGTVAWFEKDDEPSLSSYCPALFKVGDSVPVTSLPIAQAQIAARDAEIVRLLGIVNTLSSKISECGSEGYDLSGADCVDLLNDAGLIEWGTFDPEVHESSMFDGCEPGDPIWTLKGGAA